MDGVPGYSQDPVPPGGTFTYDFVVPDAGIHWYHRWRRRRRRRLLARQSSPAAPLGAQPRQESTP